MTTTRESAPGSKNSKARISSRKVKSMGATSESLNPKTCEDSRSIISSAESEGGRPLSNLPDGQQTDLFGQPVSLASRGRQQASKKEQKMKEICVQPSLNLCENSDRKQSSVSKSHQISRSDVLEILTENQKRRDLQFLEVSKNLSERLTAKLMKRLPYGSIEFQMNWKRRATPSGRLYYQLVASERLTGDTEFSGWPTVKTSNTNGVGIHGNGGKDLQTVAMSAYPTPNVPNGGRSTAHAEMKEGTAYHNGKKVQVGLESIAKMASWRTPTAEDGMRGVPSRDHPRQVHSLDSQVRTSAWVSPTAQDHSRGNKPPREMDTGIPLSQQVASWRSPASQDSKWRATPNTNKARMESGKQVSLEMQAVEATGAISNSATSPTAKSGGLNPALSRWLQGYPKEWCLAAIRAYRKFKTRSKREAGDCTATEIPS